MKLAKLFLALLAVAALMAMAPAAPAQTQQHQQDVMQMKMQEMDQMMQHINAIVERAHHLTQDYNHPAAQRQVGKTEQLRHMRDLNTNLAGMADQLKTTANTYNNLLKNSDMSKKEIGQNLARMRDMIADLTTQLDKMVQAADDLNKQVQVQKAGQ